MSEKMIVAPVEGRKIRHLRFGSHIDKPMEVPAEKYYKIAVRAGDLVKLDSLPKAEPTPAPAPSLVPVEKDSK